MREQLLDTIRTISATQGEQRLRELVDAERRRAEILCRAERLDADESMKHEERIAALRSLGAEFQRVEAVWRKWFPTIYTEALLEPFAEPQYPLIAHVCD